MDTAERLRRSHLARWGVRTVEERFWEKVDRTDTCWLWTGAKSPNGYGRLAVVPGRPVYVHRMSWEMHYGPIPPGLFVCHHCDVRNCIRPDHLFLGTNADNLRDMAIKGRARRSACAHGHPFPENLTKDRRCIQCQRRIKRESALRHPLRR